MVNDELKHQLTRETLKKIQVIDKKALQKYGIQFEKVGELSDSEEPLSDQEVIQKEQFDILDYHPIEKGIKL